MSGAESQLWVKIGKAHPKQMLSALPRNVLQNYFHD
jgi:hypothetical protein